MQSPKQTDVAAETPATEMKRTTVYIPLCADRALDQIADLTGKKKNRLYMEGVDQILKAHGHPGLATKPKTEGGV
ncbi:MULTISPECIES: hypothetical protein [unclassified Pannonibacter]|uniref:hypothetical protein n=1 Tax=unclassified Pannonibacter TaxID=2627228 RepID=UPI0016489E94|nr:MULTISPECIES: hypothetical protein [unclassified Pannonibacter]